ncbi:hypothetical protein BC835DRAFT_1399428 [Cytidiella melzeri]|nr:hypothetical protein BC835DRAFT_1399428 [Cytidiella melzeri]
MEYCGGGDLSGVIKQAQRHGRPIPEDTIWNYFMQILLALNHCHHPQGGSRQSSGGSGSGEEKDRDRERRPQILHRDLKPDNVFLDENNIVKLGDFGLSKALAQASFANTYVGTPYYMSPELMQEKSYDSKSDIWSLGCLIYELCALKPPFHEAKTHAELSILIRNGRIPPLPKGYSPALASVIKAMLNLNPAMRPSAQQLLQHERLDLAFKVSETQKMLTTVKTHKATILAREREVTARETTVMEREKQVVSLLSEKDTEIASLRALLSTAESTHQQKVREALMKREEELRTMVLKQEAEVAARMARREEEIMEAVRKREEDIARMWADWERETREGMCRAVEERMNWVKVRSEELEREKEGVDSVRRELERKMEELEKKERVELACSGLVKSSQPLEEVKNILAPLHRLPIAPPMGEQQTPMRSAKSSKPPIFDTPISRTEPTEFPSAMKGVVLTSTGEALATPAPTEFAKLFMATPKVSLNFSRIFDNSETESDSTDEEGYETDTRPGSLSATVRGNGRQVSRVSTEADDPELTPTQPNTARPTRLRRPSIRANSQRPSFEGPSSSAAPSASTSTFASMSTASAQRKQRAKPKSRPPSSTSTTSSSATASSNATTAYDLSDEENLPSPFLKKIDRERLARTASAPTAVLGSESCSSVAAAPLSARLRSGAAPRRSGVGTLRAVAVVNAANAVGHGSITTSKSTGALGRLSSRTKSASAVHMNGAGTRSSIVKAQKASEEARKTLSRP